MNAFLKKRAMKVEDLMEDLQSGIPLIVLLEIISGKFVVDIAQQKGIIFTDFWITAKQLPPYNKNPKHRVQKLENCSAALRFVQSEGLKLVGIGPEGNIAQISVNLSSLKYLFQIKILSTPSSSSFLVSFGLSFCVTKFKRDVVSIEA